MRPRLIMAVLLTLAAAPAASDAATSDSSLAGWVVADGIGKTFPMEAFWIERDGKRVQPPTDRLQACDRVRLTNATFSLKILLINGRREPLDAQRAAFSVPCNAGNAVTEPFAVLVRSFFAPLPDPVTPKVVMGTRGDALDVPALGKYSPLLVGGKRALFVAWRGGTPPYVVKLWRDGRPEPIAMRSAIDSKSARLPAVWLEAGRHTLEVTDAAGAGVRDDDLQVVPRTELPPPPATITAAQLSATESALMHAWYLENLGDGGWTLEALQIIAELPADDPTVRDWLRRFGSN